MEKKVNFHIRFPSRDYGRDKSTFRSNREFSLRSTTYWFGYK